MKNDHFLRIYDINNFKLIKKYGSIGRGPGEYIRPNTNDLQFSTIGNKGIWITDFKFKIFIDIDSVINKENYIPSKRIPLLPEFGPINYLYKVSDYLMVGNSSLYKKSL